MEILLGIAKDPEPVIVVSSTSDLSPSLSTSILSMLKDKSYLNQTNKQVTIENTKIAFHFMEIPSDWNPEGMETLLLVGILDGTDDSNTILELLAITAKNLQEIPDLYKGFYNKTPGGDEDSEISEMVEKIRGIVLDCKITLYPNRKVLRVTNAELNVLGIQKVGKSSVVYRMTSGDFTNNIRPTLAPNILKMVMKNINFRVHDMAGQVKFRNIWMQHCTSPQAIIYVIDSSATSEGHQDNIIWFQKMMHFYFDPPNKCNQKTPVLILANKHDLNPNFSIADVEKLYSPKQFNLNYAIFPISALTGEGLSEGLEWMVSQLEAL